MNNNKPSQILKTIKQSKNALIIMDSRFDFDALSSVAAMSKILQTLKVKVECIYLYELPQNAKEFFSDLEIKENYNVENINFNDFDIIINLDTAFPQHISKNLDFQYPKNIKSKIINIDHHESNTFYGHLNYVLNLSSTTRVLYKLIKAWKMPIDKDMANKLLIGQLTDTGLLQNSNTRTDDFDFIQKIIKEGADYLAVIDKLIKNKRWEDYAVMGIIYSNLVIDHTRKIAYSTLTYEELEKKNFKDYTVGKSDLIKNLKGMDFVFVIETTQDVPEAWKISLRSVNNDYDVKQIAESLGGGGHKGAAGCIIPKSQAKNVEEVVNIIWKTSQKTKANQLRISKQTKI